MVLEALKRPFTRRPKEAPPEQPKQKPLESAVDGIGRSLKVLDTVTWQGVYAIMEHWEDCIQVLYDQCPEMPVNDAFAAILRNAQQNPVIKDAMKDVGIEGDLPIHPSWLRHGYTVDVDWKKVDLPESVKKFLHHSKSTETSIQIGAHVTNMPPREYLDKHTVNHLSLWVGNRGVELLVTSDYWPDGVAGVPHTDYVSQLRFVKPLKGHPNKLDLKDPRNFDQFGETEMSREGAVATTKIIQFALAESLKVQELQDVRNLD